MEYDSNGLCELLLRWVDRYPIVSIEDPLAEDDEAGMIAFTKAAGHLVQIVGDDYLVTNAKRVEAAAAKKACNAVLLKPNQAGTITETSLTPFPRCRVTRYPVVWLGRPTLRNPRRDSADPATPQPPAVTPWPGPMPAGLVTRAGFGYRLRP